MKLAAVPRGDSAFDEARGILERVIAPIVDFIRDRIAIRAFRLGPHHGIGNILDIDARIRRDTVDRSWGLRNRRSRMSRGSRGCRQFGGRGATAEQAKHQKRRQDAHPWIATIAKIEHAWTDSSTNRMRYVHESSPIAERSRGHRAGCGYSG